MQREFQRNVFEKFVKTLQQFCKRIFALFDKLAQTTRRGGSLYICHLLSKCRQYTGEYLKILKSLKK
jgi:hypothetical protein